MAEFCAKANEMDFNAMKKHLNLGPYRVACRKGSWRKRYDKKQRSNAPHTQRDNTAGISWVPAGREQERWGGQALY
jgi:hypothetical protein